MPVFTLSNYRALTAGKLALSPSVLQLLQTSFPAKLIFFPFQWLNRDQEAVRYTEAQLANERRGCPGELSTSITSDYFQFYPEDFEGTAPEGSLQALFIQGETSMSVFNLKNVPQELSPYQKCVYVCLMLNARWAYGDISNHRQGPL